MLPVGSMAIASNEGTYVYSIFVSLGREYIFTWMLRFNAKKYIKIYLLQNILITSKQFNSWSALTYRDIFWPLGHG